MLEFDGSNVTLDLRQVSYDVQLMIRRQFGQTVGAEAAVHHEELWHRIAANMGMKFSEKEIVEFYTSRS